ncbi:PilZ domain-containing protein [uncultured Clostridium sp.]|uniref:flagellar brake protein n=1 Tax=uncultured Clostridium sp. TaxID=59620 RepID=UPI0025D4AED1|nr:PilZ domain-containing protein [uncultured Clostridium sp.]
MNNFELDVNERLEIILNDKIYKCLVTDLDDDSIKINIPVCESEYLTVYSGKILEINMYLESGKCYNFNARVLSKGKEGNVSYYKLSEPFNIKRIQRRNYFRVGILNLAHYKNITNFAAEDIDEIPYTEALMIDLSGGGVKLKINDEVKLQDILSIKMNIKNSDIIVRGEVVRIEISEDKQKLCGVKFLDISQDQIDRIIEQLFEIMRKQRALT